jgi:hypothetical protein
MTKDESVQTLKSDDRRRMQEMLLWSIALPGFAQLLNRKYLKGLVLLVLEFLINIGSNFNEVIVLSFQGDIKAAIGHADYQWLMFYPCIYMFALWDAYRDAGGAQIPYAFLPFVFPVYTMTVGLIYSATFNISGIYFGPVFLPMITLWIGVFIGLGLMKILHRDKKRKSQR